MKLRENMKFHSTEEGSHNQRGARNEKTQYRGAYKCEQCLMVRHSLRSNYVILIY